jgi:hypothetical protein
MRTGPDSEQDTHPTEGRRRLPRILAGEEEHLFSVLPEGVLGNLRKRGSETALVWNLVYPLAQPRLSLEAWLALTPLSGTMSLPDRDDLLPYFWGFDVAGRRLEGLDAALTEIDGPGKQTEVDLFLMGRENLVVAEAKHLGTPGRCRRYASGICPEAHSPEASPAEGCRYWASGASGFAAGLDFGLRPVPGDDPPPCFRHYQLARTLLVGLALSSRLGLRLHVWLITPRSRWARVERTWLDFADRVKDPEVWRRLRVVAWEDIAALPRG